MKKILIAAAFVLIGTICFAADYKSFKLDNGQNVIIEEVNYPLDTSCNPHVGGTLRGHENSCLYSKYALAANSKIVASCGICLRASVAVSTASCGLASSSAI